MQTLLTKLIPTIHSIKNTNYKCIVIIYIYLFPNVKFPSTFSLNTFFPIFDILEKIIYVRITRYGISYTGYPPVISLNLEPSVSSIVREFFERRFYRPSQQPWRVSGLQRISDRIYNCTNFTRVHLARNTPR